MRRVLLFLIIVYLPFQALAAETDEYYGPDLTHRDYEWVGKKNPTSVGTSAHAAMIRAELAEHRLYEKNGNYPPVKVWFGAAAKDDPTGNYYNLMRYLDTAKESIYAAIHELDLLGVARKLAQRAEDGIYVEIIVEKDYLHHAVNHYIIEMLEEAGVKYRTDYNSGIMHNKYIVVDKKRVWSGSANYTEHGYFFHYNDSLWLEGEDVAKRFLQDYFSLINPQRSASGDTFKDYTAYCVGDVPVELYFSPGDRPTRFVERAVKSAKKRIDIATFVFSHKGIAQQLKFQKVPVRGVFDNSFAKVTWPYVPFYDLAKIKTGRVKLKWDSEEAKVHHKLMIIDDGTVITGSLNFSKNAEKINNENMMIFSNSQTATNLVREYSTRFKYLWTRFPRKSLYEQFIDEYERRAATNISVDDELGEDALAFWSEFKRAYFSSQSRALYDIRNTGKIEGIMRDSVQGNVINVEIEGMDQYVTVRLAGIIPPYSHERKAQQPQAEYALQYLSLEAIQKPVIVEVISEDDYGTYTGIVYHSYYDTNGYTQYSPVSLNEMVLRAGWGYLEPEGELKIKDEKFLEKMEKAFLYGKSRKAGIWSQSLKLEKTPWQYKKDLEEAAIKKMEKIARYSMPRYKNGAVLGYMKNGKYYTKESSYYWDKLEDINTGKYVFFKTAEDAERAGFIKGGR